MDNTFGITPEDIENFNSENPADLLSPGVKDALADKHSLDDFLLSEAWLPRAKKIGRLPGISNAVKCAAILVGPGLIFSTLLILHSPVGGQGDLSVGISLFGAYMKILGYDDLEIQAWVSMFYLFGVLRNYPTDTAELTESAASLNTIALPNSGILWNNMHAFQPKLEALGVEFKEDFTIFELTTWGPVVSKT